MKMILYTAVVGGVFRCSGISVAQTAATSDASHVSRAPNDEWSEPKVLRGVPEKHTMRSPSLAFRGNSFIVAANVVPVSGDTIGPRPLVIIDEMDGRLPIPNGDLLFAYPKGVVDRWGNYHLFWAHGADPTARTWAFPGRLTSLWHAIWDGKRWTEPEALLRGRLLLFDNLDNDVALDDAGRVHVVVPFWPVDSGPRIAHLTLSGTTWSSNNINVFTSYASIAAVGRDSLVVAYDQAAPQEHESLFSILSTNAGASWDTPTRVDPTRPDPARSPILRGGSGLDAFWLSRSEEPLAMYHAHRAPSDARWIISKAIGLEGIFGRASVSRSPCGEVVAVVERIVPIGDMEGVAHARATEVDLRADSLVGIPLQPQALNVAAVAVASNGNRMTLLWTQMDNPQAKAQVYYSDRLPCTLQKRPPHH